MKKTRLWSAIALASCVMLSGCDIFGGKSSDEPAKPEQPTGEVAISVSESLPKSFVIGEEVNLDSYVSTANTSASYSVVLDEASKSVASVDGHKIKVLSEGEVKFTVSVEGKSASGAFAGWSELRSSLVSEFGKCGKNYTAMTFDDYGEYSFIHNDHYFEISGIEYGETEADDEEFSFGYLSFPEHRGWYVFEVVAGEEGEKVSLSQGQGEEDYSDYILPDYILDYINGDFSVDFSNLKVALGKEERFGDPFEVLTVTGEAAATFVENSVNAEDGGWEFTVSNDSEETKFYPCTKVEFFMEDVSSEDANEPVYMPAALCFIEDEGVEEFVSEIILTADPELVGDELLDAFVGNPENIPAGGNYAAQSGMDKLFSEYIPEYFAGVSFMYGWYLEPEEGEAGFVSFESEEEKAAFMEERFGGTIFEGVELPTGFSQRWFSENGILNTVGLDYVGGLVQVKDGENVAVYDVEANLDGSYSVYENDELASVYDDPVMSLSGIAEAFAPDSLAYMGSQSGAVIFQLNPYAGEAVFDAFLQSESTLSVFYSVIAAIEAEVGLDLREFIQVQVIITEAGEFSISYAFGWDSDLSYVVEVDVSLGNDYAEEDQAFIDALFAEEAE